MHKEREKEKMCPITTTTANRNNKQQRGRAKQSREEQWGERERERRMDKTTPPRALNACKRNLFIIHAPYFPRVLFNGVIPLPWFMISHMNSLSSYLLLRVYFPGGRTFFFSDWFDWNVCLRKIWQLENGRRGKQRDSCTNSHTYVYMVFQRALAHTHTHLLYTVHMLRNSKGK